MRAVAAPGRVLAARPLVHPSSSSMGGWMRGRSSGLQQQQGRRERWAGGARRSPLTASIRVQQFDGQQQLPSEFIAAVSELLNTPGFRQQVCRDCQLPEGTAVEFEVRGSGRRG